MALSGPSQNVRPDFSGRWIATPAGGSDPVRALMVTQTDTMLAMQDWSAGGAAIEYPFDGPERQHVINGALAISKARWNGAELIIETTLRQPSEPASARAIRQRTETWSLDREGVLTIVVNEQRSGAPPSRDARRYRRR
jgi:hypothetical protein